MEKAKDVKKWLNELHDERDTLREENTRLLAAVQEMQKMLPVLDKIENYDQILWEYATRGTGIATLNAYRIALETALAKRNEP